ncbi:hypothetical protein H8B06_19170 [Sphingobacterium sp. DN00404]|uniref:Uncharacterized protein n=1 Tax=Sphingobacterium micropteri TaxID=2763501 RepID=A0ABR7YUE8_9SPHI|nr:hypothetical protein [Sphingobacterium micropteri]MBD1434950.1 hypothetical protein [Sphingobacterium micropteri]
MDWFYILKHWGCTLILAPILSQLAKEIGLLPIRLSYNTALGNENTLDKIDFNHLDDMWHFFNTSSIRRKCHTTNQRVLYDSFCHLWNIDKNEKERSRTYRCMSMNIGFDNILQHVKLVSDYDLS